MNSRTRLKECYAGDIIKKDGGYVMSWVGSACQMLSLQRGTLLHTSKMPLNQYKRCLPRLLIFQPSIMSRGAFLATICFTLLFLSDSFIPHLSCYKSFDRNINRKVATIDLPPLKTTSRRKKLSSITIEKQMIKSPLSSSSSSPRKRNKVVFKRSNNSLNAASPSASASASPSKKPLTTATSSSSPPKPLTSSSTSISSTASTTTSKNNKAAPTKKRKSRSSTMPGFRDSRGRTSGDRAFSDGLNILQSESGRNLKKVSSVIKKEKERAKKRNQDHMYLMSDSVPISLMQFVEEIHKEARITPAEEVDLGTKTQEAIRLQRLFANLKNELKREPTDDEWCAAAGKFNMEALRQTIDEGAEAKKRLVASNLRMVQRVVNLYIRNGLGSQYNAGDLMQEGGMALIRAAEKFEPQRGFRFSTYAMYWIRASVKRSQISQSRSIYVPQRLHELFKKIQLRERELESEIGRKATTKELADDVNLTIVQLERCVTAMKQRCFSLDAQLTNGMKASSSGDNKKSTMYDLVSSNVEDDSEYRRIEQLFVREDLIESLRRYLNPLEVKLLLLRYGLMDDNSLFESSSMHSSGPKTINQVSEAVGLKPDKVRRLINNSLIQLKGVIEPEWQRELA